LSTQDQEPKRPPERALRDGRALQAAIADGSATRESGLNGRDIEDEGTRFRVFSHLRLDAARRELADVDRDHGSNIRSEVDGLRLSIKGNIPHRDLPWTEGVAGFRGRRADNTAAAVARLEAAGAVTIGTTTLTELAMYAPDNPSEPVALNPWAPSRTPGGSSSGAGAAAALGLAEINLCTDAGGSTRNPALHCGVFGFKPSLGRWTFEGLPSYAPALDTLGVICRSMEDVIATDGILAEIFPEASTQPLRLRIPEHLLSHCDRITRTLFDALVEAIAAQGIAIDPITIASWEEAERSAGILSRFQATRAIGPELRRDLSPRLQARLAASAETTEAEAARAADACEMLRRELPQLLDAGDVVLTPGWPFRAPHVHQTHVVVQGVRTSVEPARNIFVRAANAARAPALSVPAGCYPGQVPFGLHLMAEEGADLRVLHAGRAISTIVSRLSGRDPARRY